MIPKVLSLEQYNISHICPCFSLPKDESVHCVAEAILNSRGSESCLHIETLQNKIRLEKMKLNKKKKKENKTNKMVHIFITAQPGLWHNALQFHKQSIQIIGYKITF